MNRKLIYRIIALILCISVTLVAMPSNAYASSSKWNSIKDKATDIKNSAVETKDKAKEKVKEKASDAAASAKEGISNVRNSATEYVNSVVTKIDTQKFKNGWDIASKYVTSNVAAQMGSTYVQSVQTAITNAQTNLYNTVNSNRTLASNAGFVAEEWHTSTFNIDSVARGSSYTAERPASNGKASADVVISNGKTTQEIGLKYYKDGTSTAKAQSKSIIQNYNEYLAKAEKSGTEIMSFTEYLDANVKLKEAYEVLHSEYASEYAGQTRLIPADQMDDAAAYLKKKIGKESSKDSIARKELAKGYKDTLDNLADKITAKDGTQSIPLTEEEAKALVDLCENGDFDIEDFKGIKTSQIIKPKYILKQSMIAGGQAASLEVALTVGPEVYAIIADGIKNGYIDEQKMKEAGVDAAFAGANGFVEGSVSAAIITACKAGKFGAQATNLSPDAIGIITVLTIDSIKYGYKLANGEITADQYGDLLAEEIFVAVVAGVSGAVLQSLLPCVPIAYLAGSMVGGMVASAAYETGKEVVLQVAAGNGFEAILPSSVNDAINIGKETVASVDVKKIGVDLTDNVVSTTKEGLIKIKSKVK